MSAGARSILGVLALIGIVIRNSVILIVQIDHPISEGRDRWHAVIEASEHRMRPIALTAAVASLALIPIAREASWGPMAYAVMGGISVGTVLAPDLPAGTLRRLVPNQSTAVGRANRQQRGADAGGKIAHLYLST